MKTGERFGSYSPERRTALVMIGTGAHGAYHAGVLRALQEAGVKIDLLAGQGIGAGSAALAASDGSARLWDGTGIWRSPRVRTLYGWNVSIRSVAAAGTAILSAIGGALLMRVLAGAEAVTLRRAAIAVGVVTALALAAVVIARHRLPRSPRRRAQGPWWWRLAGAPFDAVGARELFAGAIWDLIRGAAQIPRPAKDALGRRYSEALHENLGHPGYGELLLIATDLDARRDVVAALLREPYRGEFLAHQSPPERRAEVLDLAGIGRDHALDIMAAAMTPPLLCEAEMVAFASDSYWRGETHRLCDRPGAIHRLLQETAAAGVTQAVVVSAVAGAGSPHRLRLPRVDLRSRLGELVCAAEAAALRDALETARLRFDSVYVISPAHNAVGPFDLGGAYDEASDRGQDLPELMQRGYEDAYRQFIEPIVGASGEQLVQAAVAAPRAPAYAARDSVFHDPAVPD